MTTPLPSDLIPRAWQLLQPLTATEDDREALLLAAFYSDNPTLYDGIDREGSSSKFALKCIKTLLEYGCLAENEHSLSRLLGMVRKECGVDKHPEIDTLKDILNQHCQGAAPPQPFTPTIVPAPVQTIETPRSERRPTVFISYAHDDVREAERLVEYLGKHGHSVWMDRFKINFGDDQWFKTIAEGIRNSYAFVPVVTGKSLRSRWVQREILWAQKKRKPIIPLIVEDVLEDDEFILLENYPQARLFDRERGPELKRLLLSLPAPNLPEVEIDEEPLDETPEPAPALTPRTSRPDNAQRRFELSYLERLKLEELVHTERYTRMAGTTQRAPRRVEMRGVFELHPTLGRDRKEQSEPRRFEDAVKEILAIKRAVLLGEPGAGKTTTLWKLAADLVEKASEDRRAPIPLLIRLGKWTDDEQTLEKFIASQLDDLGAHLDRLLSEKRAALLLDGLNELPAGQHKTKYPQVQRFIERHRALLAVVSCRALDYTIDLGFDRIVITPLDPRRIREFIVNYLGEAQAEKMFWRLAGGMDVRDAWKAWEKAGGSFDSFWTAENTPKNFWMYWREEKIWREKVRSPHSMMELARNPYMLFMLTSVWEKKNELPANRGTLFEEFVEELLDRESRRNEIPETERKSLLEGLDEVAYQMQIKRAAGEDGNAQTVLPLAEVTGILGARRQYLAASAGIIGLGEQVRFTHQLLQEYFVARYMKERFSTGLKATEIWKPDRWWERTNWEEATKLLAGLYSDDCTPVVEWAAQANPEVAAQCIVLSGAGLAEATRKRLRDQWIPRLTDLKRDPDPKARAAVGRALGLTGWDNRKGVGIGPDNLPDFDWVEIPGGEFQYGDKSEFAAKPEKLKLPTFHISRWLRRQAQPKFFLTGVDRIILDLQDRLSFD